jgi:HPt (histidine-containing phosphotransfer) domain-containing protein
MTLIDWDHLMSLRADIGEEDFADVAFVFFSEIDGKLADLQADHVRATAEDFHFLRGSAANLGFSAMVAACAAAEAACAAGKPPDLAAVVESYEAAMAELRPRMPELDAA